MVGGDGSDNSPLVSPLVSTPLVCHNYPHSRSNLYLVSRMHCICITQFFSFAMNFFHLTAGGDAIHAATGHGNRRPDSPSLNSPAIMAAAGLKSWFASYFASFIENLTAISYSCYSLIICPRRWLPLNHPLMRLVVKLAPPSRRCVIVRSSASDSRKSDPVPS